MEGCKGGLEIFFGRGRLGNMGAQQRRKGANGEREAAAALRALGVHVERTARNGVDMGVDIQGSGLAVEVKRRRKSAGVVRWLGQARAAAKATRLPLTPVVLTRGDNEAWTLILALEDVDAFISAVTRSRLHSMHNDAT